MKMKLERKRKRKREKGKGKREGGIAAPSLQVQGWQMWGSHPGEEPGGVAGQLRGSTVVWHSI
jgi:hypothetical protein